MGTSAAPRATSPRVRNHKVLDILLAGIVLLASLGVGSASASTATVSASPSSGSPGTPVTVVGSGFPARASGAVQFSGAKMASFRTTKAGGFSVSFSLPTTATGPATITATARQASASTSFNVTSTETVPTPSGFVSRSGTQLRLGGAPYRFTGLNAYHLSTDYAVNYGCGENNTVADVDAFFASLRPNSMVRVWAFQQLAWDKTKGSMAFTTFDRIVASAEKHGHKLVMSLANQWDHGCGETRKNEWWYGGGYRQVVTDGTTVGQQTNKLSYWDYVRTIVPRYANSPAVGMWEPLNEPEPSNADFSCTATSAATFKAFFDVVGGEIHRLDPNHLVSSGLLGSGQCGAREGQYETLHQSPGIDVASYHDYGPADQPIPGDQWNGLQVRLNQMARLGKPLFVGEVGIKARDGVSGCLSTAGRRDRFKAKMDAQFAAGVVGFMPWVWVKPNSRTSCTDDFGFDIEAGQDLTLTLLRDYPL